MRPTTRGLCCAGVDVEGEEDSDVIEWLEGWEADEWSLVLGFVDEV